jgi:outer membrane protein assembly factor BamB
MQPAQEWGLIAMRPVVTADRIFVRLLYSASPLLVCLEKSSGKLLWASESREHEFLVSDPLIIQGQLVALSVVIQPDQQGQLRYIVFDPQTGEAIRSSDLLALRSTWGTRAFCEIIETEDGLAIVLGGAVVAVNIEGKVRWARTQSSTSADEDPRWVTQRFQQPLLHDGRLFAAQPGVRAVDCLDAHTGRRHWTVALPEIVGLIGVSSDLVMIQTESGIQALQISDGARRWQFPAAELFSFHLVDGQHLLIASREPVQGKNGRWQPRFTWLNSADGSLVASTALSDLADTDPRLGPLVPYRDRLFLFWGHGQNDPIRQILELIPRSPITR